MVLAISSGLASAAPAMDDDMTALPKRDSWPVLYSMIASRLQALCHRLRASEYGRVVAARAGRRAASRGNFVIARLNVSVASKIPSDSRFGLLFPSLDRDALCKDPAGGDKERTEEHLKQSTMKRRSSDAGLQA